MIVNSQPVYIPVPGMQEPKGLGTLIKEALQKLGAQPCDGCKQREEWLNQRVMIGGNGCSGCGK